MIDFASAWNELAAWVAAEPNRGRQATLVKMAELAAKHTVEEDELERAVRVFGPQLLEGLTNRLAAPAAGDHEAPAATADGFAHVPGGNAVPVRPSMAA